MTKHKLANSCDFITGVTASPDFITWSAAPVFQPWCTRIFYGCVGRCGGDRQLEQIKLSKILCLTLWWINRPLSAVIGTRLETHFLKLSNLEGCNDGIYKRLVGILEEKGLDRECLISLGTDGASTMVGKRSGVTTRFKNVNPFILSTHCASHRLAIVSSQAANKIPCLVKYQEYNNI